MLVTEDTYESAIADLNRGEQVTCDTETDGLHWAKGNKICGISALTNETSYYFPFRHKAGANLPERKIADFCERVLPPERPQLGFNYPFDVKMLMKEGMSFPQHVEDSQLSAHLLNENDLMKMEALAAKYLDPSAAAAEEELLDMLQQVFGGSRKTCKGNLHRLPATEVEEYACQDVITTRDLRDLHIEPLKTWGMYDMWHEVCEYALTICRMEQTGLLLDTDLIAQYMEESERETRAVLDWAAESAGYPINLNSAPQCQAWLGLPSTAKAVISTMDDERAQKLLQYRVWAKAAGTYYRPFLEYMDADNILHANLNPTGTIIRLSCRNPNLQAIPRDTPVYKIKDVFVARPGKELVEADYSQAEVRGMAHYTQDPELLRLIKDQLNMHDMVAKARNLPRDVAKRLNFSAQYGVGPATFAKTYGYSVQESRKYLGEYHQMFPGMRTLYKSADRKAQERGYIRLYTGRVQHFDGKRSPSHKASSRLIQGCVAEMMRIASVRLQKELPEAVQLLQVHDSFIFEIEAGRGPQIIPEIRRIMEDQPWCSVGMKADIKRGPSWGTAKDVAA